MVPLQIVNFGSFTAKDLKSSTKSTTFLLQIQNTRCTSLLIHLIFSKPLESVGGIRRELSWYVVLNITLFMYHLHLQCNGKAISWSHLEELYKRDTRSEGHATGLRLVPKLKYEHIYLSSFSKMTDRCGPRAPDVTIRTSCNRSNGARRTNRKCC